jgi:antitoxin HicB
MADLYKVPLVLTPQPEGGYTVTSTALPELVTEGDSVEEAIANVRDALAAVIELYDDLGKPLPPDLRLPGNGTQSASRASSRPHDVLCWPERQRQG